VLVFFVICIFLCCQNKDDHNDCLVAFDSVAGFEFLSVLDGIVLSLLITLLM